MEKISKPSRQFDDGVSLGGRSERAKKVDKNRAREMKRAGEVLPVEQPLPAESVAEELPQELVAPVEIPQELQEIFGDEAPPADVLEMFGRIKKGKTRNNYLDMLRTRKEGEASVAESAAEAKQESEPVTEEEPMPSVFHSGRREAEVEEELPVLTEVVPEEAEEERQFIRDSEDMPEYIKNELAERGTPKENRAEFLSVMSQAKETFAWWKSSDEHFIKRSQELDAEAAKIGKLEKVFRSLGENYNKLGWKSKLAVGAGLGIGAGVSASFMFPTALAVCVTGIVGQRIAGLMTMYMKFESKSVYEEKVGKLFGVGYGSRERAMAKAMAYTAGMTGAMMLLSEGVKEGIQYANQHQWGEGVREWLGNILGHQQNPSASGKINYAPAGGQTAAAAAAGEVAPAHLPEMPTVSAAHGHGYEYMMKRMWEDLQEKHINLPPHADPNSDLYKLVHADAHTIDTVVHQIANDPTHGFYNPNGTSVLIDPSVHMTIGTDGQLHLGVGDAAHHIDVIQATPEMQSHVTPAYHPEAPATVAPVDDLPQYEIPLQQEIKTIDLTNIPPTPDTILSHSEASLSVGEHLNAPIIEHSSVLNIFGMDVPVAEAHIYADPGGKHLFVYGGSHEEKMDMITTFLKRNPERVIFSSDAAGVNRVPWHAVGDKIVPDAPMKTGFIFKTFMKAPNPNEFQKVLI